MGKLNPVVRLAASTPHHDGVRSDAAEPAVIAISGTGPAGQLFLGLSLPPLPAV
jgi:hypothetical protein